MQASPATLALAEVRLFLPSPFKTSKRREDVVEPQENFGCGVHPRRAGVNWRRYDVSLRQPATRNILVRAYLERVMLDCE